jgi:hypothetical protein
MVPHDRTQNMPVHRRMQCVCWPSNPQDKIRLGKYRVFICGYTRSGTQTVLAIQLICLRCRRIRTITASDEQALTITAASTSRRREETLWT